MSNTLRTLSNIRSLRVLARETSLEQLESLLEKLTTVIEEKREEVKAQEAEQAKAEKKRQAEEAKAEKKRLEEEAKAQKERDAQEGKDKIASYKSHGSVQNTTTKNELTKSVQVVKR